MKSIENKKNAVIPVWQPLGYSTYQITNSIAKKLNIKAAHTGVLDPLAEGVIIVLTGEERFNKIEYSKEWKKVYTFEIALGIKTDSYDGMGIIESVDLPASVIDETKVTTSLNTFVGPYEQQVPLYSATKLNGKKLFLYPKYNLSVNELPTKKGTIYDISFISRRTFLLKDLVNNIITNVRKIKGGEYRQEEILSVWEKFLENCADRQEIQILKISVTTSSGIYVRSLSQDICKKLNTTGFVCGLVRDCNGAFCKNDCYCLEELLDSNYDLSFLQSQFSL